MKDSTTLVVNQIEMKDTMELNIFKRIDLKSFIGATVDSLLKNPVIKQYKDFGFTTGKPGLLSHLLLEYENNFYMEVHVNKFKYIRPFSKKYDWKLTDFKKEKISKLVVRKGNTIYSFVE